MAHALQRNGFRLIIAVLSFTVTSPTFAQLTEFQLPAGSQPTDIDVDAASGDAYFLDPGGNFIDRLSGGVLKQWAAVPCPLTFVDKIAVASTFFAPAVYSTSINTGRICILNPAANVISWWNLPFVVNRPGTLSIDLVGRAWFSSTNTTGIPAVGFLDPGGNFSHFWLLSPPIASAGDTIAGLQIVGSQLYFSVNGSANQICVINNVNVNPSPTTCYPIPYGFPAPIRVNAAGQVYRVAAPGASEIVRLTPAPANVLTHWTTPSPVDMFLSPVDPPYFTSYDPAANKLNPILGNDTPVFPFNYDIYSDSLDAPQNQINLPWGTSVPPTIASPLNVTFSGPFTTWSFTSSTGPITVDPAGPVWISETPVGYIATF